MVFPGNAGDCLQKYIVPDFFSATVFFFVRDFFLYVWDLKLSRHSVQIRAIMFWNRAFFFVLLKYRRAPRIFVPFLFHWAPRNLVPPGVGDASVFIKFCFVLG